MALLWGDSLRIIQSGDACGVGATDVQVKLVGVDITVFDAVTLSNGNMTLA